MHIALVSKHKMIFTIEFSSMLTHATVCFEHINFLLIFM
jgi:hypothetical protein